MVGAASGGRTAGSATAAACFSPEGPWAVAAVAVGGDSGGGGGGSEEHSESRGSISHSAQTRKHAEAHTPQLPPPATPPAHIRVSELQTLTAAGRWRRSGPTPALPSLGAVPNFS